MRHKELQGGENEPLPGRGRSYITDIKKLLLELSFYYLIQISSHCDYFTAADCKLTFETVVGPPDGK